MRPLGQEACLKAGEEAEADAEQARNEELLARGLHLSLPRSFYQADHDEQ